MKKTLFTIVMLTLAVLGHGQDTTAAQGFKSFFGQESTEWYGIIGDYDFTNSYVLRSRNDTIIDGLRYKIFDFYTIVTYNGYDEFLDPYLNLFMREDSTVGKLWCRYPEESEEFLIADMSLNVGDTFKIKNIEYSGYSYSYYYVQDVITSGSDLILELKNAINGETIHFIEGIGCDNLFHYTRTSAYSSILCCYHDETMVYHKQGYNECYITWENLDEIANNRISLYPNPCSEWLYCQGEEIAEVFFEDIKGKLAWKHLGAGKIDISSLPRGMYIARISINNSITTSRLIIKL
jgi:hypothetical protein